MVVVAGGANGNFFAPIAISCFSVHARRCRYRYHIGVGGIAVPDGVFVVKNPIARQVFNIGCTEKRKKFSVLLCCETNKNNREPVFQTGQR